MTPVLKKVTRLDSVPITQAFYTEEGYLKDRPILTSTGIFEYANPDGSIRRELRLPEDVFDRESLASYEGKPIIITHDAGLVTKDNVSENIVGTILSEGARSGEDVVAKIIIHDTREMQRCGLKELSLGYNLDLDEEPGEWNGQHYDAIQRNIRINHLALVREARAGEQARLNIDSKDDAGILKGGKLMSKTIRNARRNDEALSPEELQKAIEWYKKNYKAGADESPKEEPEAPVEKPEMPEAPKAEPAAEPKPEPKPEPEAPIENEEPKKEKPMFGKDAESVINDQDKDIKTLLDIIDTLLAERAFDEAEPAKEEESEDPEEPMIPEEEEDKFEEDECDTEEEEDYEEDEDDVFVDEEEEEYEEDEDDDEEDDDESIFVEDDADSDVPDADENSFPIEEEWPETDETAGLPDESEEEDGTRVNMDAVDRIVRERIKLGMIGRQLNLDGLENMKIRDAKKAIIKAVRPSVRMDGKSAAYINALYACAVDDVKKRTRKDTNYQRRQMFNKDGAEVRKIPSSMDARERMIKRHMKED